MIELTLNFPADWLDEIDEYLLENGDGRWMIAQDLPTSSAKLIGIFQTDTESAAAWTALSAGFPRLGTAGEPLRRELRDQDWRDSYKLHFKPWRFGRLHWVPIWERATYVLPPSDRVIWLDPGLAFGTGNHETTRLCCERLVAIADQMPSSTPIIDAGCGSGILALSAARLGFSDVRGFDNDPEAVRVSEENAELNELKGKVRFAVGDLISGLPENSAGIVLANIQADVLMRFANQLVRSVQLGGTLVLSGILARESEEVRAAFARAAPGWKIDSRILNEWSDVQLTRPR